ncbi:AimR family lysis-lysogeny pheromone receptor [Aquibacillus kalidii]|uniref:AimR family lysis-lysogeny pheromone receptor n=1 Tax=Aquibacillus kalidii TaxID=2762597 RepID=UPI0016462B9C|nr:AimR family lysis-lysogeny pheromone receptor [Aquibacillus kalidii]
MRRHLLNVMEVKDYTYKEIAKKVNCSQGTIFKFLDGQKIEVELVLDIVKLLAPEKEEEFMVQYCKEIDKPKHIKVAMEYCSTHHYFDGLKELINKSNSYSNKELNQWSFIYDTHLKWKSGSINSNEMYNAIICSDSKNVELHLFKQIMQMYHFYELKKFDLVEQIYNLAKLKSDELEDGYIKSSYQARMYQMYSHISLRVLNIPLQARKYAFKIIDSDVGISYTAFAYHVIALSYFNDSQLKMNHYANVSIKYFNEAYSEKVVHDIHLRFDKLNMIMSNNLNNEFERDNDDALDLYLEGIQSNDQYLLLESLSRFTNNKDRFLAQLPEQALLDMGIKTSLVKSMVNNI